jgi:hypothetical protein
MKNIIYYSLTFFGISFSSPNAFAENGYICVAENVVGIAYNEKNKNWVGSVFKAGTKYIIKKPPKDKAWSKSSWIVVEIGSADTNAPSAWCSKDFNKSGKLLCGGLEITDFTFNKNNNRFLATYLAGGFIDDVPGKGNPEFNLKEGEDTPALIAGTCSSF